MNQFICYEKCGTCKKAEKWMKEHNVPYEKRPIKEENPSLEELKKWQAQSGLPLKKFFNTSGQLYRSMELKDKLSKSVSGSDEVVTKMGGNVLPKAGGTAYDDALAALNMLGYSTADIAPVLRTISTEGMTSEQIIRAVLKFMV